MLCLRENNDINGKGDRNLKKTVIAAIVHLQGNLIFFFNFGSIYLKLKHLAIQTAI